MKKGAVKIWNWLSTAFVALVVLFALLLVGARLVGLQVYAVLSGSMEPEYQVGSLIYVKQAEADTLQSGDVITFRLSGDVIATHRIVERYLDPEDGELYFVTKGDANNVEDGKPVHYTDVIGTPVFTIPLLGYVSSFIQQPPGTYIAITAVALLLLFMLLPEVLKSVKKDEEN